ncbi:hypothetical protein [Alkalihalobacillus trypoxylicola]|uniref:Uncharacterized protein n=1 Tax=Alkalihalobacillus trypoxylicola TaxID=519424 RepID=A0A162D5I7_9BACI|nr:hypothetical protein [Alkalihalobacillus trypoxylicola]KYG28186.1 hypothetical protein AZF04_09800 [Alkalihalobacillus trypoxylicola]
MYNTVVRANVSTGIRYNHVSKQIKEHHVKFGEKILLIDRITEEGEIIEDVHLLEEVQTQEEKVQEMEDAIIELSMLVGDSLV